jgi:acyl carrier protein
MKEKIVKILTDIRPEFDFKQEDINLIEEGMLDSFDLVALVTELDETFGISINGVDIVPENFSSVDKIENLLTKKKNETK